MSDISSRLLAAISQKKLSYGELSKITGIPKSAIQRYATGETTKIPLDRLELLSSALSISSAYLMGWEENLPGLSPMPELHRVPRVGRIACGEPVLAQDNLEGYDDVPSYIHCEFTLVCKGDSMMNARIFDGDLVCISTELVVHSGDIAAVLVDEEDATLKRVRLFPDHIVLEPENPRYRPMVFWEDEMERVRIIGKATHFISTVW